MTVVLVIWLVLLPVMALILELASLVRLSMLLLVSEGLMTRMSSPPLETPVARHSKRRALLGVHRLLRVHPVLAIPLVRVM